LTFRGKIKTGKLKDAFESVSRLVHEIKLNVDENGFQSKSVDPANVAMAMLEISKDAFEEFELDESMTLGLDLDRMDDILSVASKDDDMLIRTEDGSKLEINVSGFDYSISLLDPSTIQQEPQVPDLDLPVDLVINGSKFRNAIRATEKISDYVILSAEDDRFTISAEGDSDSVSIPMSGEELVRMECSENSRSLFSLEYLSDMSKSIGKVSEANIRLGTDYPVKIKFKLYEGVVLEYLLAPRIESE